MSLLNCHSMPVQRYICLWNCLSIIWLFDWIRQKSNGLDLMIQLSLLMAARNRFLHMLNSSHEYHYHEKKIKPLCVFIFCTFHIISCHCLTSEPCVILMATLWSVAVALYLYLPSMWVWDIYLSIDLGFCSLSGETSSRHISWSIEAARQTGFIMPVLP